MKRFGWLAIFLSAALLTAPLAEAQTAETEEAVKALLLGSWSLVRFNAIEEDGGAVRRPYSVGRIDYQANGRMNAQLMPENWGESDEAAGYVAYFGTFSIDMELRRVIHHVEGAYNSNMLGQAMPRYFEFSGDGNTLFLEVRNDGGTSARLQWQREQ